MTDFSKTSQGERAIAILKASENPRERRIAYRIARCRKGDRCGVIAICKMCKRKWRRSLVRTMVKMVDLVVEEDSGRCEFGPFSFIKKQLSELIQEAGVLNVNRLKTNQELTPVKRSYDDRLGSISKALKTYKADVDGWEGEKFFDWAPLLSNLTDARSIFRRKGLDKKAFISTLKDGLKNIKRAETYEWRTLYLTIRRRPDKHEAYMFLRKSARLLWERELKVPGSGLFIAVEGGYGKHLHIHAIYFGPSLRYSSVQREWKRITGADYMGLKHFEYGLRTSIKKLVNYYTKIDETILDGENAVQNWALMWGKRRYETYGVFRQLQRVRKARQFEREMSDLVNEVNKFFSGVISDQ